MKKIFIVGNKFHEFSQHDSVRTIGALSEMARTNSFDALPAGSQIVVGQGVREIELQALHDHDRRPLAARGIDMTAALHSGPRASRMQTHKHHIQNVIISHPVRQDENNFEAALLLDERSELMNDHQTGQHIQGMILIEAARQMFLAVSEEYFIDTHELKPYYFVINQIAVKFTGFVFPVAVALCYRINSKDVFRPSRMHFDVTVSFMQGGVCVTEVSFQFTAFYAEKIKEKEHAQATQILSLLAAESAYFQPDALLPIRLDSGVCHAKDIL